MKRKNIFAFLLSAVMLTAVTAGCMQNKEQPVSPKSAAADMENSAPAQTQEARLSDSTSSASSESTKVTAATYPAAHTTTRSEKATASRVTAATTTVKQISLQSSTRRTTAKTTARKTTISKKPTSPVTTKTATGGGSTAISAYEKRVVELVNEIRVTNGLKPFTIHEKLSAVARMKSQDMCDKKYFSHTSPTYGSPFEMMKQFGISYAYAGENIAYGHTTPEAVVDGWMHSEGHRANILNSAFTQIGVGYVQNGNYWTQMFIG